jgi:hypothetical protein
MSTWSFIHNESKPSRSAACATMEPTPAERPPCPADWPSSPASRLPRMRTSPIVLPSRGRRSSRRRRRGRDRRWCSTGTGARQAGPLLGRQLVPAVAGRAERVRAVRLDQIVDVHDAGCSVPRAAPAASATGGWSATGETPTRKRGAAEPCSAPTGELQACEHSANRTHRDGPKSPNSTASQNRRVCRAKCVQHEPPQTPRGHLKIVVSPVRVRVSLLEKAPRVPWRLVRGGRIAVRVTRDGALARAGRGRAMLSATSPSGRDPRQQRSRATVDRVVDTGGARVVGGRLSLRRPTKLILERSGPDTTVTLNRPEVHTALDREPSLNLRASPRAAGRPGVPRLRAARRQRHVLRRRRHQGVQHLEARTPTGRWASIRRPPRSSRTSPRSRPLRSTASAPGAGLELTLVSDFVIATDLSHLNARDRLGHHARPGRHVPPVAVCRTHVHHEQGRRPGHLLRPRVRGRLARAP